MLVSCPNCGAPVEFKAGSSVVVVCAHCNFAVVRSNRDIKAVGRVAELALTQSPFQLGMTGAYRGLTYRVVGRLQLDHGQGPWDEWYCAFSDGRWGWLAEAQGRYYLTFPVAPPPIPAEYLQPGMSVPIHQSNFIVAEVGQGRYVSAQGELPVAIQPGGYFRYADLSGDSGNFATLDYGASHQGYPEEAYVGFTVTYQELGLAPIDSGAQQAAILGGTGKTEKGKTLKCSNCGGNLDIRSPRTTKRIVCPYCNSLHDYSTGSLQWLEVLDQQQLIPRIPIGSEGEIHQLTGESIEAGTAPKWTVIGYMTRACQVYGHWYYWDEYLLYEPTKGFRFILEQDGHWSIVTPVEPGQVRVPDYGREAYWRNHSFKKFSQVLAVVQRVLGEFYWEVRAGEEALAADYVCPEKGLVLSREESNEGGRQELNYSIGHYVDGEALLKAFGVTAKPPPKRGIAPHQPNPTRLAPYMFAFVLCFATIFVLGLVNCGGAQERHVYTRTINLPLPKPDPKERTESGEVPEAAFFSDPFDIPVGTNVKISIGSAMQNSYLWLGGALIHEKTGTVHEFEVEASYYSGVDGGESWSEGNSNPSVTLGGIEPGKYILRIQPAMEDRATCLSPVVNVPGSSGRRCPSSFSVVVKNDVPVHWPGVLAYSFVGLIPFFVYLKKRSFEKKRWSESTGV